ncbi:hypothetical protein PHJA_000625700 [Phtheirospermum japonicum]|uniref:Uncharacterized protein n=1 Tax=Phtheirospermum japonicum TaxID=374723 RepID=A0A830BHF4_9LAMI|nr:hypothetical protein PHJA_000625700 [Phtheirospermum japonicum]
MANSKPPPATVATAIRHSESLHVPTPPPAASAIQDFSSTLTISADSAAAATISIRDCAIAIAGILECERTPLAAAAAAAIRDVSTNVSPTSPIVSESDPPPGAAAEARPRLSPVPFAHSTSTRPLRRATRVSTHLTPTPEPGLPNVSPTSNAAAVLNLQLSDMISRIARVAYMVWALMTMIFVVVSLYVFDSKIKTHILAIPFFANRMNQMVLIGAYLDIGVTIMVLPIFIFKFTANPEKVPRILKIITDSFLLTTVSLFTSMDPFSVSIVFAFCFSFLPMLNAVLGISLYGVWENVYTMIVGYTLHAVQKHTSPRVFFALTFGSKILKDVWTYYGERLMKFLFHKLTASVAKRYNRSSDPLDIV